MKTKYSIVLQENGEESCMQGQEIMLDDDESMEEQVAQSDEEQATKSKQKGDFDDLGSLSDYEFGEQDQRMHPAHSDNYLLIKSLM